MRGRENRFGITALAGVAVHDTEVDERTIVGGAATEGCAALEGETGTVDERGAGK